MTIAASMHVQDLGDIWSAVERQGGAALSLKVSTQLAEMATLLGGISAKAGLRSCIADVTQRLYPSN